MSFRLSQAQPGSLCRVEDQTNLIHFGQGVCILLGDVAGYLDRTLILLDLVGSSLCRIIRCKTVLSEKRRFHLSIRYG
jgi:hypothetical protein